VDARAPRATVQPPDCGAELAGAASLKRLEARGRRQWHRHFFASASWTHFLTILCRLYQDVSLYFA
jgi:hypothetical protein